MSDQIVIDADERWRDAAACKGVTSIMFPRRGDVVAENAARALCASCPSREPCLEYAITTRQRFGIWGGLSERQRKRTREPAGGQLQLPIPLSEGVATHTPHGADRSMSVLEPAHDFTPEGVDWYEAHWPYPSWKPSGASAACHPTPEARETA